PRARCSSAATPRRRPSAGSAAGPGAAQAPAGRPAAVGPARGGRGASKRARTGHATPMVTPRARAAGRVGLARSTPSGTLIPLPRTLQASQMRTRLTLGCLSAALLAGLALPQRPPSWVAQPAPGVQSAQVDHRGTLLWF